MLGLGRVVWRNRIAVRSLRRTLVIYLMIGCLLPLVLVCALTYSSIYSILMGKIQSGISASLQQESASLENTINNLDFASKQFALDGQIVDEVSAFLQEKQIFRKSQIMASINEKMNLVNFTNPYLGLTAYVLPGADDQILFSNLSMDPTFDSGKLPSFMVYNGAEYFGPHKTLYRDGSNLVFSGLRVVRATGDRKVYIYLETNYSLFRKILSQQSYGMKVNHLLFNEQGKMTYMEDKDVPDGIQNLKWSDPSDVHKEYKGYHLFRYLSPQGWQLIAAVKKSTFNSEIYSWIAKMIVVALSTFLFAALLAYLIWRQVYKPLRKVNVEIVRMAENRTTPVSFTSVAEFDLVLNNFQEMKTQVNELIDAVANNEKQKSQFEIEKLLSQINPHFLHNTLNTVQWLARLNGQKEIDKLVTLLVKVLHYNLGKQSLIVTVGEELEAIQHYMELQRIRYDYEFEFHVDADEDALSVAVPRFLLQPIVENAIYHGGSERNGKVDVSVRSLGADRVMLSVEDNGIGMEPEAIGKLLNEDEGSKRRGLGIGLSYVNRMLKHYYGDLVQFDIQSEPGVGTKILIVIPRKAKGEFDD
ncbi:sensor histidine kinase [Cohnella endophytica]|uniref:histidine kinase n=1 Tax=Cohnella endophytica TaxID=2419778 RepID=A0A494Y3B6_9BACL|nr:sensor histidine kinase [Cohnella endophytica]RKP57149.1 sensor histidine kinase [Cohnella endophytica]